MAKINFRQGIVRYPSPSEGGPFLSVNNSGNGINLNVVDVPVQVTFAQSDQNYLFEERQSVTNAWGGGSGAPGSPDNNGPFTGTGTYHLYWDIDFISGITTRDYTTRTPAFGPTAPTPAQDQHWFDTTSFTMKVRDGSSWVEKLRVFAGTYNGSTSTVTQRPLGTQVGISGTPVYAGYILYDDANLPIQRFRKDRKGVFIHTEMPLAAQWSSLANIRLESLLHSAKAVEPIAQYQAVAYVGPNQIGLARNTVPTRPAIGIALEDMATGEVRPYIPIGYVENQTNSWNSGIPWDITGTQPPGTPLFVGPTGQLTTAPPQVDSIQQIATIVDGQTIYVQPQMVITYG